MPREKIAAPPSQASRRRPHDLGARFQRMSAATLAFHWPADSLPTRKQPGCHERRADCAASWLASSTFQMPPETLCPLPTSREHGQCRRNKRTSLTSHIGRHIATLHATIAAWTALGGIRKAVPRYAHRCCTPHRARMHFGWKWPEGLGSYVASRPRNQASAESRRPIVDQRCRSVT